MLINVDELLRARKAAEEELKSYDCRVLVCSGTGCIATGSNKIHEIFEDIVKDAPGVELVFSPCGGHDDEKVVGVKKTGCQGFCELGPLVRIQKNGRTIQYVKVQPEDCQEIFEQSVLGDEVIERLLYHKGETAYVQPEEIPFIAKQTRIVLENCGRFDAESLDEYLAAGGFEALRKAMFELGRDGVIDEIDKSGLRGRGGGGFPTGRKWQFAYNSVSDQKYVVCNGDEGDPGAFMDRSILEDNPLSVIEGMTIAGYAIGASEGYFYVRAEYPTAVKRLRHAIEMAEAQGLLGDDILGSGFSFRAHIRLGAEVRYCEQLLSLDLRKLTLGKSDYLLLELPGRRYPAYLSRYVDELLGKGIVPILAHVERCVYFREEPSLLKQLIDLGALAQVSAQALFNKRDKNFSIACLSHGLAQIVASDAHDTTGRKPCMDEIRKLPDDLQQLHNTITSAVWDNELPPYIRATTVKKTFFGYR